MAMKVINEWYIDAPWGKIALISWGTPKGEPVLLVHGRQDSVATFIPLLETMPSQFFYVGLDLPGHGKSDPFPPGVILSRIHFLTPVDLAVKHLGWKKFCYMCHSMGGEIGLFYNAIRPGKIKKFIHLDIGIALFAISHRPLAEMYATYDRFYERYDDFKKEPKKYTKQTALEAVMGARKLPVELAELVLSRNLQKVPFANNKNYTYNKETGKQEELEQLYTLTWDRRLKTLTHLNLTFEQYVYLFTKDVPPTLFIEASESKNNRQGGTKLIDKMKENIESFEYVLVEGSHDVHLTHPDLLKEHVCLFLEKGWFVSRI